MATKNVNNKFRLNDKARNWGKVKFNPVKEANATPWSAFKHEMQHRPNDDEVPSQEEQSFKKMREKNYKKMLMEEKRKEPKIWEDFNERSSKQEKKAEESHRLTAEDLHNYDPKKLSFAKKNHMRQVLTGCIAMKHTNLKKAVANLKRREEKKNLKKHKNPFA